MRSPLRAVLVDDDPDFLALATHYITGAVPELEITLTPFSSSVDALDYLFRRSVDLVITDYRMPFVDGIELITALRTVDAHVAILMVSDEDVGRRAERAGASAFLPKAEFGREFRTVFEQLFGADVRADRSP